MIDRIGPWFCWALFLVTVWFWARPVFIFIAASLIVGAVLVGVFAKLDEQSQKLGQSWRCDQGSEVRPEVAQHGRKDVPKHSDTDRTV